MHQLVKLDRRGDVVICEAHPSKQLTHISSGFSYLSYFTYFSFSFLFALSSQKTGLRYGQIGRTKHCSSLNS
jgi:hypothetical protein